MKRTIRLRGVNGPFKGRLWEATDLLRIGRLDPLEIVLDDNSVSRNHAEVRATDAGWRVRDLGSTNGTRLNGVRLANGQWPLRQRDLLQFGEVAVVVEAIEEEAPPPVKPDTINELRVEASKVLRGPSGPPPRLERGALLPALADALYASKVSSYAQGIALLAAASKEYGFGIDYAEIARTAERGPAAAWLRAPMSVQNCVTAGAASIAPQTHAAVSRSAICRSAATTAIVAARAAASSGRSSGRNSRPTG